MKMSLFFYSPSGRPRCNTFFIHEKIKNIFGWNRGPLWFIKHKSKATVTLRVKKHIMYTQYEVNNHGSWRYIEVLWSKSIGPCKKLNIIHNIIACNP